MGGWVDICGQIGGWLVVGLKLPFAWFKLNESFSNIGKNYSRLVSQLPINYINVNLVNNPS